MASTIRGSNNFDSVWGNGQTYNNLTASRAVGTIYTNSTAAPIFVYATIYLNISSSMNILVNSTVIGDYSTGGTAGNGDRPVSIIVPAGSTYQIANTGGTTTLISWFELR